MFEEMFKNRLQPLLKFRKNDDSSHEDESYPAEADDIETNASEDEAILGLTELYVPEVVEHAHERDISDVLLDTGKITKRQHQNFQHELKKTNIGIVALLLERKLAKSEDIAAAKAKLHKLELRQIDPQKIEKEVLEKLPADFIKTNSVCPVAIEDEMLVVATSEPENVFVMEDVERQTQMKLKVVVASDEDIQAVCNQLGGESQEQADYNVDDIISDMTDVELVENEQKDYEDLEKMAGQSPVIKFVNYLISNAIKEDASDIHIEPKAKFTKIRYRIDGALFEIMQSPSQMHPAVVSRIKIMSGLDISERRLPQDGKISVIVGGRGVDLRVSTLPTSHGEKVVIRVLDSKSILLGLERLGMEPDVLEEFGKQALMPHGILLVTGPTGSGKSTTLYSALTQMDGNTLNISTVEDPVEYELDFCNQVHVLEKIGMTFALALRSLLRQDPDIVMIGEIRDNETARIAVQAALTGHLVLSTLHTNDAPSSITRLVNIGIDAYLIAASLNAVLAQRLVRKICSNCKENCKVPDSISAYLKKAGVKPSQLFHGVGCDHCRGSGYSGRIGIYELLVIDDVFKDMINEDSSVTNMQRVFHQSGQASLFDDGIEKVKKGLTTVEEVLRVTKVYGQNEDESFDENIGSDN